MTVRLRPSFSLSLSCCFSRHFRCGLEHGSHRTCSSESRAFEGTGCYLTPGQWPGAHKNVLKEFKAGRKGDRSEAGRVVVFSLENRRHKGLSGSSLLVLLLFTMMTGK